MITISIIIVNWNTKHLLQKCVISVEKYLHELDYEIIVVDNDSTDGSQTMIHEQFPQIVLIENRENVGFAKANNQAIHLSQGKYLLLLNSDAFLTPDAIQEMIHVMEHDLSIGITGPQLVFPDGNPQLSHGPLPNYLMEVSSLFGFDKLHKKIVDHHDLIETGTVSGACILIRKVLLDQIGLLDEDFYFFSEEVDLCYRCHKAGFKVVHVASAVVIHVQGGSTGQTVQRLIQLYSGKLHYFYKHFGPIAERNLKYMMIITSIFKVLYYRLIRVISLGHIQKDNYWWTVSRKLVQHSE